MAWAAIEPEEVNGVGPALAIGCSSSENHLCQAIPGCNFSKADGIWRVPLTWPGYVCFRTAWGTYPIEIHPQLESWATAGWQDVQKRYADRIMIGAPPGEEIDAQITGIELDNPRQLTPPQRGGVAWLVTYGRAGLEDPMGNGKSPQVIRALQVQQRLGGGGLPALIVCPGAALYPWRDKLAEWAPELRVQVVTGTALRRRQALDTVSDVYLIAWPNVRLHTRLAPYPGQRMARCPEHGGQDSKITAARCEVHEKELNGIRFGTIVADEAHRMRNARSKQTRAIWHLAHHAEFFWPVTGTLVADTVEDPWAILYGLFPRAFPSKSRYLDMFAIKDYSWNGGTEILGIRPDTEASFHAIVQPYFRRIPKEIARPFQPPRLEPEFRYPELSPAQSRAYKQLVKETLADLYGYTVVPDNAAVKFGRLYQLASSMIEVIDGEDRQGFTAERIELILPSNKADDLLDFLEDTPGQVVVYATSPRLIELAEKKLHEAKITSCKIVGGMTAEQQYQANQWFLDGDCRVIFLSEAGSESIDLQVSDTVYFLQPNPSFLAREQVIGRVDRFGQQRGVRVVYALSPGTVDRRLYQMGCDKEERHQQVARDADLMRWVLTDEEVKWQGATGSS
jgi:SNF2 family DNA or RNA helicase